MVVMSGRDTLLACQTTGAASAIVGNSQDQQSKTLLVHARDSIAERLADLEASTEVVKQASLVYSCST